MQENRVHFRKTLYFKMIMLTVLLGAVFFTGLYAVYKMSCQRFEEELTYHSDILTEQVCRSVDVTLKELSEKAIPLTITNERLGPILTQISEDPSRQFPPYLKLHIKNSLDEFVGMNYETNWIAVIDQRNKVYISHRDPRKGKELISESDLLALYQDNENNLADRSGNTVWIASPNTDSIILMRAVFDSDTMRFCGCIVAEVKNTALQEIFDHIDSSKAGDFILYDRNGLPIYTTLSSEELMKIQIHSGQDHDAGVIKTERIHQNDRNILQAEYFISRGKLKIVHRVDLDEKNQRFSDLLNLISGIGLLIYALVMIMLWFMFGNMAKNLKVLSGNLIRVSCGDFRWTQTHFGSGSELDVVSSNIHEMSDHIKQLMEQEVRNKELQQQNQYKLLEARYQELQAQVNPHFLFNVLQSINGIAQINGDQQASRLICMLSKFFRGNVDRKYKYCELYEELEYARNYLELYENIYPDRLDIQWDVDESLLYVGIPTYILQPIVENSLIHGMEPVVGTCTIRISAAREKGNLVITVWDNGAGIPKDKLQALLDHQAKTKRVGMRNVQDRIQICYGDRYGLQVSSEQHKYTEVKIVLPLPS